MRDEIDDTDGPSTAIGAGQSHIRSLVGNRHVRGSIHLVAEEPLLVILCQTAMVG